MRRLPLLAVLLLATAAHAADDDRPDHRRHAHASALKAEESVTDGQVNIGGAVIPYHATAGTLIVHPKGWSDTDDAGDRDDQQGDDKKRPAVAAMSFVYYARSDVSGPRPLTFLFNGGPGSATVWLHMGAFGPRRVVTGDAVHVPGPPYRVVDNDASLLDASDLVFIDAPGTGFGRIEGDDKEKAFWGVDQDAHAFGEFVETFLTKYSRWNSPRYLFGESYGTTRAAVLVNQCETDRAIGFNGVLLLSQVLSFGDGPDSPQDDPGHDLPYVLALPTYAATAWYHHKLPDAHADLPAFLREVEQFATTVYLLALQKGAALDDAGRHVIVGRLHAYTGLPEAYLAKADLRVSGAEFTKMLQDDTDTTTGRLDTRYAGPTMDPLSRDADYDPQSAAIGSAYVSAYNDYARHVLQAGDDRAYKSFVEVDKDWEFRHAPPGSDEKSWQATNVMADLANALKYDPALKVQVEAGYFDLATPYYGAIHEMAHLRIPAKLQANIEFRFYQSGHMVYAHDDSLRALHDNVADFIRRTLPPPG